MSDIISIESCNTITGDTVRAVSDEILSAVDVSIYKAAYIQMVGTFSGSAMVYFSNNGITWFSAPLLGVSSIPTFPTISMASALMFYTPVVGKYIKIVCTSYTSGSLSAVVYLSEICSVPFNMALSTYGYCVGSPSPNSCTTGKYISLASTNASVIKAGAGRLMKLVASNTGTAIAYLKLHNATSVTPGTTTVISSYAIPASSLQVIIPLNPLGDYFSTGIGMSITGTYTDTDTTALSAAGTVIVNYTYA